MSSLITIDWDYFMNYMNSWNGSYIENDNNINKEMHGELNSVVNQLEKLDSRYGLLYGLDREGIKLQNPKDMVYIYMDDNHLYLYG